MGMKEKMGMGGNRTGLARHGDEVRAMEEGAREFPPNTKGDGLRIAKERVEYAKAASAGIGTLPPPASAKQVGKAAVSAIAGGSPNLFVDKLGERLAFERTGTRLYDALLSKLDAYGSFDGGPSRAELEAIRHDELAHFHLLRGAMEKLGADPTAMTPSADVTAVASTGLNKVLADARTDLKQSLEAILIAELADNDGWEALIELAREAKQTELAREFEQALVDERDHLRKVRAWVAASQGRSVAQAVQPRA